MQAEKTPKLNDFWNFITEPPVVVFDSDILYLQIIYILLKSIISNYYKILYIRINIITKDFNREF